MNVCFVTPEYFPISGGTGAYVYYLSHSLQKLGHNVHVVARHTEDAEDTYQDIKVHYIKGTGNALTRYWKFARSAAKKIETLNTQIGIDIIHANLPLVPSFAIPKDSAKALVCAVHSTWKGEAIVTKQSNPKELNPNEKMMLRFNRVLRRYETQLMNRSDALIAVSKYTVNEMNALYGIPEEKIHVIYNGVDIEKFKPKINKLELRQEFGPDLSDEELLLRVLSSNQDAVDKLLSADPQEYIYPRGDKPLLALIQELIQKKRAAYIHIEKGDFSLTLC